MSIKEDQFFSAMSMTAVRDVANVEESEHPRYSAPHVISSSVEHLTDTERAVGAIPTWRTILSAG